MPGQLRGLDILIRDFFEIVDGGVGGNQVKIMMFYL